MTQGIELQGLIAWGVARCSELIQAKSSIPQQEEAIRHYAKLHGITLLGIRVYAGYSASLGEQMDPLLELIAEKEDGGKFDMILLDSYNRFIRSDVDEAKLFVAVAEADLVVVTIKEGPIAGQNAGVTRFVATLQSVGYVRELSRNINRAIAELIRDGKIPPTTNFVFGADREYYDDKDVPQFRVRKLTDGRYEVLDPIAPYSHRYYIPRCRRLGLRHEGWKYKHVPGLLGSTDLVLEILIFHYRFGWAPRRITAEINRRCVPTPRGKPRWTVRTVLMILQNPLYLGLSVGSVFQKGSFTHRNKGTPAVHEIARRPSLKKDGSKERRKTITPIPRDSSEWDIAPQEAFDNFVPNDVKLAALVEWDRKLKFGWNKPIKRKTFPRSVANSSHFLSGLIKVKSDGTEMLGATGGPRAKQVRYYRTYRDQHCPKTGEAPERCRADVIEPQVIAALQATLGSFDKFEVEVRRAIAEKVKVQRALWQNTEPLLKERSELEEQYKSIVDVASSPRGKALMASKIQIIETRLEQLDSILEDAKRSNINAAERPEEIFTSVKEQFAELGQLAQSGSAETLRGLCRTFVSSIVFDAATRNVEIEFALPSWGLTKAKSLLHSGTETSQANPNSARTTLKTSIILLKTRCEEIRQYKNRRPCLVCRRIHPKAA